MARRERPLDPAAGPLESFAHDLRALRVAAGEPTYRQLAQIAGYSASTLSEAASGVRLPTLSVTLAFVGACSGDTQAWEHRWKEVNEAVRAAGGTAPCPADEGGESPAEREILEPDVPDGPAPPPVRREFHPIIIGPARAGRTRRNIAAITAACALAAGLFAVGLNLGGGGGHGRAGGCPALARNPRFTATAYGDGAHVLAGAGPDRPEVATYPAGCVLGFTGFCIGAKVTDRTAGIPDTRWFILPDGHVVASAAVHGNPPARLAPSACAGARPAPERLSLKAAGAPSPDPRVVLTAAGPNVQIVGFAAYYAADPASPELRLWHQIGMIGQATPSLSVTWRPDRLPAPLRGGDRVLVAAVACLGGGDSGYAASVASLRLPAPRAGASLASPSTTVDQSARQAACKYPSAS
ncbi:helix-turn-helix domain-containing protein [Actinomadura violacea]|uniref:Helix-turn-helix transcriptional regulator n=1 Tax=Actinomadura violacea TaxID=2819934 RepID=A0ABS3RML7_9ACTN|nr:helix-turn-helix transcriptional regulator [Actinomadura violacea]MBO2457981.1 helix-turn-helix transcriptional regulator [Actinomadura violacea]